MNLGAVFIGFALLVASIPYVINPIINERKNRLEKAANLKKDGNSGQIDTLAAIRDLDFDFQTGKVAPEDYETLRAQLVLEAAEYLQKKQHEEEKIEAMIRARRQHAISPAKCEKCGGEIRPQDRFCPSCRVMVNDEAGTSRPAPQMSCPGCGKNIKEGDLFCPSCGTEINKLSISEIALNNR